MAFTIERIKSFLAKRRLPQFGHEANKDTYSVSLVLFQLCEHDKHFIFHPLFEPEAFHLQISINLEETFVLLYIRSRFSICSAITSAAGEFGSFGISDIFCISTSNN